MKLLRLPLFWIFLLFFIVNAAYLHRMPGLLGDEGSEGENVYQILHEKPLTVIGERSYIGPLIDYVRIPFVATFGYTALALRALMLVASVATFFLAYSLLRRFFGEDVGSVALVMFLFSPIFLLQQRIGWAITLNVFFFWLLLYALTSTWNHRWLLSGLIAGVGLSNDFIFFPTLVAVLVCVSGIYLLSYDIRKRFIMSVSHLWLVFIGFIAGFGTQFAVLLLFQDDQGSRAEVAAEFTSRLYDFLPALPLYISGSSYVARYIGSEFSPLAIMAITSTLCVFAGISLFYKQRIYSIAIIVGLGIHSYLLLYMVDRFTLRYFALFCMVFWLLAGLGLGSIAKSLLPTRAMKAMPIILACFLTFWTSYSVFIPFLRTGGSLNQFSLGNRNDKSSAFVDIRPLVSCIEGRGSVYSPSQDIFDRLQYIGRGNDGITVVDGDHKNEATLMVSYKKPEHAFTKDESSLCPDIPFFSVVKNPHSS